MQVRATSVLLLLSLSLAGCVSQTAPAPDVSESLPGTPHQGQFVSDDGATENLSPQAWYQRQYSGQGTYRWPDGSRYSGTWRNSQPHGEGHWQGPDGSHYQGQWQDGKRHGPGTLVEPNGNRYEGAFADDQRHGQGRQNNADGTYQGEWFQDQPQGEGVFDGVDGSRYVGAYQAGARHGAGQFASATGSLYEGDWLLDEPSGFGVLLEAGGGRREGQWLAGASHGYGTYEHPAGLSYAGNWAADQRSGFGAQEHPDGSRYEGEWAADQPTGQGTMRYSDGRTQVGLWRVGQAHGAGTLTHPAGYQIIGTWRDGALQGGKLVLLQTNTSAEYSAEPLLDPDGQWHPNVAAWLQQHAQDGHPAAAWLLAERGFTETQWLANAAEANIALAQYALGKQLLDTDVRAAVGWLNKAANGSPHTGGAAHFLLGSLYHFGELLPQDQDQAESHYLAAIERGSIAARRNLAAMLATTSIGYLHDPERALGLLEPIALLYRSAGLLDALALVYQANGRSEAAAQTQQSALDALAKEAEHQLGDRRQQTAHEHIKASMTERLAEYRAAAQSKAE